MDTEIWIAYPTDRPPFVVELPRDYSFAGHVWRYERFTPESAKETSEFHKREYPAWTMDAFLK